MAAVVSGASSGIGAATAIALAGKGFPIALGARRVDRCEELAAAVRATGGEAAAYELDVTDEESVAKFAAAVQADLGPVDTVVANAGLNLPGQVHQSTAAQLQAHLEVNLVGAQRLVQAFAPSMVERRTGDLVFVSSDVVDTHRPFTGSYNASKAGLEGLVRTMQRELEGTGVRASLVRPGPTMTEMGYDWPDELTAAVLETWVRWGLARHSGFLPAEAIANAVLTVVTAPRGTHITAIDVQPEAPVQ